MGPDEIVDVKLLNSKCPDGSGRAARHAYPGRSSIEPTTILLLTFLNATFKEWI
jgi:hypothetical protein